jgi:glyoxylase-like metal-dependent hydrolase (beta-lactamase superfamily II)
VVNAVRVERILAPNPSPMTLEGTNSYLIFDGSGAAVAIDPGPADAGHIERIASTAQTHGATITAIAVTHGHPDHAPGAALLHERTRAPVHAHRTASFPVDVPCGEGDRITAGDARLDVIEAPGHTRDHLVFSLASNAALFTGDVIVGRGTIVIAPPHGDMRDYQATLERLRSDFANVGVIYGGHGDAIFEPRAKFDEYIEHRKKRERELLAVLATSERTVPELVETIYAAVSPVLWPAAARQLVAYLIALEREGRVFARSLGRTPTESESAILNPDLSRIVDPETAAIARAELGYDRDIVDIEAYALAPTH